MSLPLSWPWTHIWPVTFYKNLSTHLNLLFNQPSEPFDCRVSCIFWVSRGIFTPSAARSAGDPSAARVKHLLWKCQIHVTSGQVTRAKNWKRSRKKNEIFFISTYDIPIMSSCIDWYIYIYFFAKHGLHWNLTSGQGHDLTWKGSDLPTGQKPVGMAARGTGGAKFHKCAEGMWENWKDVSKTWEGRPPSQRR